MFTSPSAIINEVGDHDVTVHDGRIHLHYLSLPNHDTIGHAISDDGLDFTPAPAALRTGDPGACDSDMIWTMHTVRSPQTGLYHMYYTACDLAEHGQVQRVALAFSDDLTTWRKHDRNPVCEAALPHYNADLGLLGRVAFRDPFVFIDDDGSWHMLVCASAAVGDRLRRGCIAHATSADGIDWVLQPPLYAPCQFDDIEVPALLKHGGKYYLFIHEFRTPESCYRIADAITGPWRAPAWDQLLPDHNAVNRFCEWQGQTLMYTWFRCQADWPRRSNSYCSIVPPKQVNFEADGRVRLSSFSGWRQRRRGQARQLEAADLLAFSEGPARWRQDGGWLRAAVDGQVVAAAEVDFDDFILRCQINHESGRAAGLILRGSDDLEDAVWLRLDVERRRVELHHYTARDSGLRRWVRAQPTLKQAFAVPLAAGSKWQLAVIAAREYIEVSLDDRIVISAVTYARRRGRLGVFVENGAAGFGPLTVQPICPPSSGG